MTREDYSRRMADLRELGDRLVDECPNLRDFPLGGAGYAEAIERYHALHAALELAREATALEYRASRQPA